MEQLILRIILERAGHELYFAEDGEEALAMAKLEGAVATITKPVDPDELLKVVEEAVAGD